MSDIKRPLPRVLRSESIVPKENLCAPRPATHKVKGRQPFYYTNDTTGEPAGHFSDGTPVAITDLTPPTARVVTQGGLAVVVNASALEPLSLPTEE